MAERGSIGVVEELRKLHEENTRLKRLVEDTNAKGAEGAKKKMQVLLLLLSKRAGLRNSTQWWA